MTGPQEEIAYLEARLMRAQEMLETEHRLRRAAEEALARLMRETGSGAAGTPGSPEGP